MVTREPEAASLNPADRARENLRDLRMWWASRVVLNIFFSFLGINPFSTGLWYQPVVNEAC